MYKVKPKVKNPAFDSLKKRREAERKTKEEDKKLKLEQNKAEQREKAEEKENKQQFHAETLDAINSITPTIAESLKEILSGLNGLEYGLSQINGNLVVEDPNTSLLENIEKSIPKIDNSQIVSQLEKIHNLISKTKAVKPPEVKVDTQSIVSILEDVKTQISNIQIDSPEPVTEWDFEFVRDRAGYTQKIEAKAKRTLN